MKEENIQEIKGERGIYELAFHIEAGLSETDGTKVFDKIKKLIENKGGEIIAQSVPKKINLAYTISIMKDGSRLKHTQSLFAWIVYEGEILEQKSIDEEIKEDVNIIRYLIVNTTKEKALYAENREQEKMIISARETETEDYNQSVESGGVTNKKANVEAKSSISL